MYKRKKTKLWTVIVILLLAYFGYTMYDLYGIYTAKKTECNTVQVKINQEKEQNSVLTNQKEIKISDEYIEKIAREKLGLVKKGEKVFIDIN